MLDQLGVLSESAGFEPTLSNGVPYERPQRGKHGSSLDLWYVRKGLENRGVYTNVYLVIKAKKAAILSAASII